MYGDISFAGAGQALSHLPTNFAGWRPPGVASELRVRWVFPTDNFQSATLPITSFEVASRTFPSPAVGAGAANDTSSVITESKRVDDIRLVRVPTRENLTMYSFSTLAFSQAPIQVRIRPQNPSGFGPWSEWSEPIPETCSVGSYLVTHTALVRDRRCAPCPTGAFCGGGSSSQVTSLPGFWRVPWSPAQLSFKRCRFPQACKGYSIDPADVEAVASRPSSNFSIASLLVNGTQGLPQLNESLEIFSPRPVLPASMMGRPAEQETCGPGYEGVMCVNCAAGFAPGVQGCQRCPPLLMAWLQTAGITVGVTLAAAWLVKGALQQVKGQSQSNVVPAIKITFSHLQTIAIASAFDINWPMEIRTMFQGMDSATSVAAVVSTDCMVSPAGSAPAVEQQQSRVGTSRFFINAVVMVSLPLLLVFAAAVFWTAVLPCWLRVAKPCVSGVCGALACRGNCSASPTRETARHADRGRPSNQDARLQDTEAAPRHELQPLDAGLAQGGQPEDPAVVLQYRAALVLASSSAGARKNIAMLRRHSLRRSTRREVCRAWLPRQVWTKLQVTVTVLLFAAHMSVTKASLRLMTCFDVLGDDQDAPVPMGTANPTLRLGPNAADTCSSDWLRHRRLLADPSICCNDAASWTLLLLVGYPGLILFAIGIPVAAIVAMSSLYWKQDGGLRMRSAAVLRRLRRLSSTIWSQENPSPLTMPSRQGKGQPDRRGEAAVAVTNAPRPPSALHSGEGAIKYGFLTKGFRPKAYFWECLVMLRKVVVAAIAVFMAPLGASTQVYASLLLLFVIGVVQSLIRPYQTRVLNALELSGIGCAFVTLLGGLVVGGGSAEAAERASTTTVAVVTWSLLVVNVSFLLGAMAVAVSTEATRDWAWRCCTARRKRGRDPSTAGGGPSIDFSDSGGDLKSADSRAVDDEHRMKRSPLHQAGTRGIIASNAQPCAPPRPVVPAVHPLIVNRPRPGAAVLQTPHPRTDGTSFYVDSPLAVAAATGARKSVSVPSSLSRPSSGGPRLATDSAGSPLVARIPRQPRPALRQGRLPSSVRLLRPDMAGVRRRHSLAEAGAGDSSSSRRQQGRDEVSPAPTRARITTMTSASSCRSMPTPRRRGESEAARPGGIATEAARRAPVPRYVRACDGPIIES